MTLDLARLEPGTVAIPPGWWSEIALPAIDEADSWDRIDELEAALKGYIAVVEQYDADATEFEKALRCVERRRGELLDSRQGQRTDLQPVPRAVQVPKQTATRYRQIAEHWDLIHDVLVAATERKQVTQSQCLRLIREHTPAQPDASIPDSDDGRIALLNGDFRDRLADLAPGSVDLIVTDPPYPKDDLPLYSDLAAISAKLLGPRGILFVWAGQIFLPEVIRRLSEHLTYGWAFALQLPGSGSRIMGRHIVQAWKPVLAFTTGTWPSGEWGDDWLISPSRDKAEYEWQQNAEPARRLIERYSPPDGLVVDPFLGVGSFGVAAVASGRRFVGVELDAGRFAKAQGRIGE